MSVYYRPGIGWYINIQINGARIHRKAGDTEAEAVLLQAQFQKQAAKSKAERSRHILFDIAAQDCLQHVKATLDEKTYLLDLNSYEKHVKGFFKNTLLHEIDNSLLLAYQRHNKKQTWQGRKISNRSVNIHVGFIRKVINYAIENKKAEDNKLHFPQLREAKKVHAFLEPQEFQALTKNVTYDLGLKRIEFGRYTGLRPEELAYLAWDDINPEGNFITVQSKPDAGFVVKVERQRVIPLSTEAVTLLQSIERVSRWVFSTSGKPVISFKKSLATAAAKAGIKRHVTPNMLRHTFGTQLLRSGADIYTVAKLMGHSSIRTTEKYLHTSKDAMKKAVELLNLHKEK